MSKEYPLYPKLSEEGQEEAQRLVNDFKKKLSEVAEETIGELYCDVVHYIESDSWTNFRNELMEGFKDYNNRKIQSKYDFKEIRQKLLKDYYDDIVEDLSQDLVEENEKLKEHIKFLESMRRY